MIHWNQITAPSAIIENQKLVGDLDTIYIYGSL